VHRKDLKPSSPIRCVILTVSDRRDLHSDLSGDEAQKILESAGCKIVMRRISPNKEEKIRTLIKKFLKKADLFITIGGTGIGRRDLSVEALQPFVEKRMDGFGELFRWISFKEIGTAAMLSRAFMGTKGEKVFLALPGSRSAVRTALRKILLPELGHIFWELKR
jgi:molybdenum cofactor biosynthesis protein B